jgi:hypothetical protein
MSYIHKLLGGVEVEWKTLGEVLIRTKGTNITANQMKILHKHFERNKNNPDKPTLVNDVRLLISSSIGL